MALIVAARFETFDAAKTAAASLMNAGVTADNLHTHQESAIARVGLSDTRTVSSQAKLIPYIGNG
jgi:hypothetical protein